MQSFYSEAVSKFSMIIIAYKKVFFFVTGVTVALSIAAIAAFGLNFGVDFTGGTLVEVRYEAERPAQNVVAASLRNAGIEDASVRPSDDDIYIIRSGVLSGLDIQTLPDAVSVGGEYPAEIERFTEIGPTIGQELRNKALVALVLVAVAIVLYIAFTFRHVSRPVSSWVYGAIAVIALIHDILVPAGLFAVLGQFFGAQVDSLFVMALLAILGYSVNDTIVVFDRVRENLRGNIERGRKEEFCLTVGRSLTQTIVRSLNTSITSLLALLALFFLGPNATQDFALTLIAGVIAGTYSSIALAAPLLVAYEKMRS